MKRKSIHQNTHPFDPYPFEVYWYGSWQKVERLRICDGVIRAHIIDDKIGFIEEINIPNSNIRIRSKKATLSDCTCFLRPGVDVCVLSTPRLTQHSDADSDSDSVHAQNLTEENTDPVWIDGKISSIERKPHEDKCACQFYVKVFNKQGPAGMKKKTVSKETTLVQLDQISILQKLEKNPTESEHYRWILTENCLSITMPKLFTGKFSSDLSWMVVASVLEQLVFDVRSINNKLVYHIHEDENTPKSQLTAVNFKLDNEIIVPDLVPFVEFSDIDVGSDSCSEITDLRRSKRRNVQPERYVGSFDLPVEDYHVDASRVGLYCKNTRKEEDGDFQLPQLIPDESTVKTDHCDDKDRKKGAKDVYKSFIYHQRKIKYMEKESDENKSQVDIETLPDDEKEMLDHKEKPIGVDIPACKYVSDFTRSHKKKSTTENFLAQKRGWDWKNCRKKPQRKRNYSNYSNSNRDDRYDVSNTVKKPNCASLYREMIRKRIEDIDDVFKKQETPVISQWNEFCASNFSNKSQDCDENPADENEDCSETEMLFKEMEYSLQSMYVLEEVPAELQNQDKDGEPSCEHDYLLNEELGIYCRFCGFVSTEIRDVTLPFLPSSCTIRNKQSHSEGNSGEDPEENGSVDPFCIPSLNIPLSETNNNKVWALIPDLKEKLRVHQKKAFEFLWKNVAGCLDPALMESARKKRGGCVISHSPGAGKTFLIIAFLVSYLKLYPESRPLVLAPKSTLYTWYKEFKKWNIPIPVYQIHGGQTYKGQMAKEKVKPSPGVPRDQTVLHVLDCLDKIKKWLSEPSVLIMGYPSFVVLTREDSKHAHRQYMSKMLRQCPGILILDEGHNPRSTKSGLRKGLMKVHTRLRILLSGTLFQNNFGEYFNTLCLARPRFVTEVSRTLDPNYKNNKRVTKTWFSLENRARKLFITKVGDNIDSIVPEERFHSLNMLKNLTSGFIDVYEGGGSEMLPGIQCYTCMIKSTTTQTDILSILQKLWPRYNRVPLESELLITLGSIHPSLINSTACAKQFFDQDKLQNIENTKFDIKQGAKVRFVMSLIPKCLLRNEKVLIFCHNIAPINYFVEIFQRQYAWRKGKEVLVLQGDTELFERGRIMDKFENPSGKSKVMLASINACAEGISLTAASRVILLDSEWNPSKTKQAIARAFRPGQDKVVYVYQLLASGTLEEEKYKRTTWKEWVSNLMFSEEHVDDPSKWEAPKIEDEVLREIVEEDKGSLFHMIMKNEKASNGLMRSKD